MERKVYKWKGGIHGTKFIMTYVGQWPVKAEDTSKKHNPNKYSYANV